MRSPRTRPRYLLLSMLAVSAACSQPATSASSSGAVADTIPDRPANADAQPSPPTSSGSSEPSRDASAGSSAAASANLGAKPALTAGSGGGRSVAVANADSGNTRSAAGSAGEQAGASAHAAGHASPGEGKAGHGAGGMEAPTRPSSWRVAFLGDSITETSCTSQLVWNALRMQGRTDFDLVGTKTNQQGCGVDNPDRDCEGHSGYLVTEIVGSGPKASELPMWCAADRADLALMHFGTNDAWNSDIPIAAIVSAYSDVIAALRAVQPHVIVLAAQIIPLRPDNCPDCDARVRALNEQIPTWAAAQSTPESPIYVVDQWTGFDPGADTGDRVHPNMQGSQKMAEVWLAALRAHKIF